MTIPTLNTKRLMLRGWRDADRDAFAEMNADAQVMRHFPAPLSRDESDRFFDLVRAKWAQDGLGWFAVSSGDGAFLGFTGLNRPRFTTHFTPCVEIGWRMVPAAWGKGYATEAAQTCLDWGFGNHDIDQIVSFAVPANTKSTAVMRRLGMVRNPADDFEHPSLEPGHPLRAHVLYRLHRTMWDASGLSRSAN